MKHAERIEADRSPLIIGLGELIWDLLPAGKQLGGAPTNFAYISRLLGNESIVASRVGDDKLGQEALERLDRMGISTRNIQLDSIHPTGTVGVRIDERGEASFEVREGSAWDYLELTSDWKALAPTADAICFGTLGQRNPQSRQTILDFLKLTRPNAVRVFDVNLRHSFFTPEMLRESLQLATIVKLNREELSKVDGMLGLSEAKTSVGVKERAASSTPRASAHQGKGLSLADQHDTTAEMDKNIAPVSGGSNTEMHQAASDISVAREEALARTLITAFDLDLVAITHGEHGSLLVTKDESIAHPVFRVQVKDTIGAGDAFTAALVHHYLRRATLKEISEAANRMGAWLSTQCGATPDVGLNSLDEILRDSPRS